MVEILYMETRETRRHASEVKFLVTPALGAEIECWAKRWLAPDPHGAQYCVSSLYLDTAARDVFERNGSFGRAKYRIRRYDGANRVFLERKLRSRDAVIKRRSEVEIEDLHLLEGHSLDRLHWGAGYWFHRRIQMRRLHPVWQISYCRTARVLSTKAGEIRLTLDRELRAQPVDSFAFGEGERGVPVIPGGANQILELKFRNRMPVVFRDLMRELVLKPQPVSKFRLAAGVLAHA